MINHEETIDFNNEQFILTDQIIKNTNRSVFLTGKAGTGKSTFLKYLAETTKKNVVIVAPTGIAALNAGGVTIHSFFSLPYTPFVWNHFNSGQKQLFYKYNETKREVIRKTDIFIIDEVSMVRADVLDAIDFRLRHFGGDPDLPFGGKQMLFVGDPFQLEPVINKEELKILNKEYDSYYFFSSKSYNCADLINIELIKIYRQKDDLIFTGILNNIRENNVTANDLNLLNTRCFSQLSESRTEKYITLATTKEIVDRINKSELSKINSQSYFYTGNLSGDFVNENKTDMMPTEIILELKVGVQVIFVKNDPEKRWINGTIGIVSDLSDDYIEVTIDNNDKKKYKVDKTTWQKTDFEINSENGEMFEKSVGTFNQYPLKLAWAITIHKSQGLTFEKIYIDLGRGAFSSGQLYVALSRCVNLEGIILATRIKNSDIITNKSVFDFKNKIDFKLSEFSLRSELLTNINRIIVNRTKTLVDATHYLNCSKFLITSPLGNPQLVRDLSILYDDNEKIINKLNLIQESIKILKSQVISIEDEDNCYYEHFKNRKCAIFHNSGVQITDYIFDYAYEYTDGLSLVIINRKYGFIDKFGLIKIPIIYDKAYPFSDNLALVKFENEYHYLNKSGESSLTVNYDEAYSFYEGRALVCLNNLYGYINKKGEEIIKLQFKEIGKFVNDFTLIKFRDNNTYGIINIDGEVIYKDVIPSCDTRFDFNFFENVIIKHTYTSHYIDHIDFRFTVQSAEAINKNGKILFDYRFVSIKVIQNLLIVNSVDTELSDIEERYGIYNLKGELLLKEEYDIIDYAAENIIFVNKGSKYRYYKITGDFGCSISPLNNQEYDFTSNTIGEFSEGMSSVSLNGKYGFIDLNGNLVIDYIYDVAYNFKNGLAKVEINKNTGFINKSGEIKIPLIYKYAEDFNETITLVEINNKYGLIDIDNNLILPIRYSIDISMFNHMDIENLIIYKDNQKFGAVNKKGDEIIPFIYDEGFYFWNNSEYAVVRLNKKYGVINKKGDVVLFPNYDEIIESEKYKLFIVKQNHKFGIVNFDGQLKVEIKYSALKFYDGVAIVVLNYKKHGIIDDDDNIILPIIYDKVEYSHEELFKVTIGKTVFTVNQLGEII